MSKKYNINWFIVRKCRRFFWNYPRQILLYPVIKKVWNYTQQGYIPLVQVHDAIRILERDRVNGAIVVMGCWKGGVGALAAWSVKKLGGSRTVWLFDSFEGLPAPTEGDARETQRYRNAGKEIKGALKADIGDVREIVAKLGVADTVRVVNGWFQETVPRVKKEIGAIALLRLDADLYESTKYCLRELYDHVARGGLSFWTTIRVGRDAVKHCMSFLSSGTYFPQSSFTRSAGSEVGHGFGKTNSLLTFFCTL